MLDPDVYGDEPPAAAGASSGGSSSKGGSPSFGGMPSFPTGGAGMIPTPTAGQPNKPDPDPNDVPGVCSQYCNGYAAKCPQLLEPGQNCQATCQQEMSGSGDKCEKLGIRALRCLTPFFANQGTSCDVAVSGALAKCTNQVRAFNDCAPGNPQPNPPDPPEPQPPQACPGMGEAGPGYCKFTYSCPQGPFTTTCSLQNGANVCQCYFPQGGSVQLSIANVPDPCSVANAQCGITGGF